MIGNLSRIMGKLQHLFIAFTKKDAFTRLQVAIGAFNKLKEAMCSTTILATLNFSKPFVIECDSLGNRIGVVLMQDGYPLAFESKHLSERN